MDDDPIRACRRWLALEEAGRVDEADRAFEALFKDAAPSAAVSHAFTAATMAAVAAAAERDARRTRRVRSAALVCSVAGAAGAAYFGAGYVLGAVFAVFVRLIDLLIDGVVYVATAMQSGVDLWTVAGALGRATAAVVADPRVAVALVVLQGVAIAAFVALRRLLDSDGELLK